MGSSSSNESLLPDTSEGGETPENDVLRSKAYRPMKRYFALTCQCWSFDDNTSKAKRILYRFLQFMIACFALFYFAYTFPPLGSNKKPYNLGYLFLYYPITLIENAMWEFRWLVTCWLGILLTNQVWQKQVWLKNIKLEKHRWKNVKYFSWGLGLALLFMWMLNVLQNFVPINFKISQLNLGLAILVDSIMTLLDRILAFPLFFLFCATMYTLCCMVEEYCQDIKTWETSEKPENDRTGQENKARERFREIKDAIHITGLSFEFYLMIHFLFLVCTFFLGVCACFEQMEVKIAENYTMPLPFQIPRSTRFVHFFGNLSVAADYTVQVAGTTAGSARLLTPSHAYYGKNAFNNTGIESSDAIRTEWLKMSMQYIAIGSVVKTLESVLLYLLPVILMVMLDNRMRRVYEVIEDSNVKTHPLFHDVEVIRRMCRYVKTAHGLKIYGYTVPKFQAFMLAAFGTFFAVIIKRLLLHIHMK